MIISKKIIIENISVRNQDFWTVKFNHMNFYQMSRCPHRLAIAASMDVLINCALALR